MIAELSFQVKRKFATFLPPAGAAVHTHLSLRNIILRSQSLALTLVPGLGPAPLRSTVGGVAPTGPAKMAPSATATNRCLEFAA